MKNFERKLISDIHYVNEANYLREVKHRQRNQERDTEKMSSEKINGRDTFESLMNRVYNSNDVHGNQQYIGKNIFETGDYTDWLNVNVAKEINKGKIQASKPNPVDKYQEQIQEMYTTPTYGVSEISSDWIRSQGHNLQ